MHTRFKIDYCISVGNLKAACEAVSSYLLFYPDDETMLSNKEYYSKLPKVQDDYFIPRPVSNYSSYF